MRFRSLVLFITALGAAFGLIAAAPPKKPAPKKTAVKKKSSPAAQKPATAAKASPTKRAAASRTPTTRKGARTGMPTARRGPSQQAPTPDRYREIQSALAQKGYLKSEPTGVWDADSIDAMKRYQADQKQDPSGKLTAASLIGLGLGPSTAAPPPQAPVTQPAQPIK